MPGYAVNRLAAVLSRRLPLAFCYWLAQRLADLHCLADAEGRQGVAANLHRILAYRGVVSSRGAVRGLVRKTYQHFGKYIVDFYRYSRAFCSELDDRVNTEHPEHLEWCLAQGRGAIMVTAHVGNWEVGALTMARQGHTLTAVVHRTGVPHLDRLWDTHREQRGLQLLPVGQARQGLIEALHRRGLVCLLVDRDFTGHGRLWPFFGAPARLPFGAAILSARTRAPVLPTFMIRMVDDSFLLRFFPPIDPYDAGSIEDIEQGIVAAMEAVIGEYPYQWFIFRDFWATQEPAMKS